MASLRRLPGSQFWICCYTDASGRQRQCSSKTTNRTLALKMAEQLEEAWRTKKTETQIRRVMGELIEELHAKSSESVTVEKYFVTWLARIKPEVSEGTYARYTEMTKLVTLAAPDVVKKQIDRLEAADFVTVRNNMHAMRAPATTNLNLKIFKYCIRTAMGDGLITTDPSVSVSGVKANVDEAAESKRPFTADELSAILAAADDEWRGMILAGYHSAGQRLSDVATLTANQVDLAARLVKWTTDKTGRLVITPISDEWLADLTKRMEGKGPKAPLFPRASKLYLSRNKISAVSNRFRALLAKVGLANKPNIATAPVEGRRTVMPLSYHSFRHTATSLLKRAGVSNAVVMDIVGHDSEAVSQNYTHIDEATKRAALAKLPPIGGVK